MIEKPAAKYGIKRAIFRHIPGVITDVFEVVQIGVRLDVLTSPEVVVTNFDTGRLEAQTSELDRVTTFETAEVGNANFGLVTRKDHTQQTRRKESKPWMFFNREPDFRARMVPRYPGEYCERSMPSP